MPWPNRATSPVEVGVNTELLPLIAGLTSSTLFAGSHLPMLWKAYRTRNVSSYSGLNFVLVNVGNLIFWMYIVTLPMGPIWILHTFYTVSSVVMFAMYVRFAVRKTTPFAGKEQSPCHAI